MQFSIKSLSIALAGFAAVANALPGGQREDECSKQYAKATDCSLVGAVLPTIEQDGCTYPPASLARPIGRKSPSEANITAAKQLSPPSVPTPKRVLLGKGTQNYTCASSTANAVPVAYGAYAELYDASCLATDHSNVLHSMPGILLDMAPDVASFWLKQMTSIKVGMHYFSDATTAVFDFRKGDHGEIMYGKRAEAVPAPSTAKQGTYGAVDWLKIAKYDGTVGFTEAYRVHTAGGKAPKTCQDMPAKFEVPYATEYCEFSHPLFYDWD